jgi:hypothetical protein
VEDDLFVSEIAQISINKSARVEQKARTRHVMVESVNLTYFVMLQTIGISYRTRLSEWPNFVSAPTQASHNPKANRRVDVRLSAAQMKTAKGVNNWMFFYL